ncbi:uncharacterized protein G2W53_005400 [Senna tora]|uniref:Uncharacterized protein n=1 Tax=Senna tora TaxID=362788 RepID=A0A834X1V9_9FABA|nr:uncharacterized protein G2W53_005400 [Senna tora]
MATVRWEGEILMKLGYGGSK